MSDDIPKAFTAQSFSAIDYLNSSLPSLQVPSTSSPATSNSLTTLSNEAQRIVSLLNAQLTRLSALLTRQTDDILRSGGRLSYEVEILKGDTISLGDSLVGPLRNDLERFASSETNKVDEVRSDTSETEAIVERLRALTKARARLDEVVKVFGKAMEWPTPPLEQSQTLASSIISVSAPQANSADEAKGRQYAEKLRSEINELLNDTGRDGDSSQALDRIEELTQLALIWKNTGEEKTRNKFVENLQKSADERQKPRGTDRGYGLSIDQASRSASSRK